MSRVGERPSVTGTLRLALWCASLVAACRALLWLGADTLSIPLHSPGDVAGWAADTPPAAMAMALLRAAGIASCAYLLAVTVAVAVAHLLPLRALTSAVERVTPALVRRIALGGSGAGLVLGTVVGSMPVPDLLAGRMPSAVASGTGAPAASNATETATMARDELVAAGTAPATMTGLPGREADPDPADTATMDRIEHPTDRPATTVVPQRPPRSVPTRSSIPAPPLPRVDAGAWVVEPGDSLWAIAEDVVHGEAPHAGDRAVSAYWRRLVAANRSQLVDPDNPDLLVPGQHLVLPRDARS